MAERGILEEEFLSSGLHSHPSVTRSWASGGGKRGGKQGGEPPQGTLISGLGTSKEMYPAALFPCGVGGHSLGSATTCPGCLL